MCGTENRTQLPLADSSSSCCSTGAAPGSSLNASVTAATDSTDGTGRSFEVEGLTCGHCVRTIENAVTALDGVDSAAVDLVPRGRSRLTVTGNVDATAVGNAVTSAGYAFISH